MTKLHLKMAEMMNMSYLPIGDSSHDLFISQVTDNLLKGSRFQPSPKQGHKELPRSQRIARTKLFINDA